MSRALCAGDGPRRPPCCSALGAFWHEGAASSGLSSSSERRWSARAPGPSRPQNQLDAEAVCRMVGPLAALRERPDGGIRWPISARAIVAIHHSADDAPSRLAGVELGIRLLVDYREPLVRMRTALYKTRFGTRTTCGPEQTFPGCALADRLACRPGRRAARSGGSCAAPRGSRRRGVTQVGAAPAGRRTHRGRRRRDAGWREPMVAYR
jgi:hypothetical protein